VSGVTNRHILRDLGSSRVRAASTARSAQSILGLGCWRRSTATSCAAPAARRLSTPTTVSSAIHPARRTNIRYSSRTSQAPDPAIPAPITAGILAGQLPKTRFGTLQGGATTINEYLAAGLIDELRLHIVPLTLGAGTRLFEGVPPLKLEQVKSRAATSVMHVTYRVLS
jgi:riboflavin biosynthesis pyrimidine reductase